jgi:DNA-binding NarL/FixJ family response regulator
MPDLWEYTLSPQQRSICKLLAQGMEQKKVAEALGISAKAVSVQLCRIKQKQKKVMDNKNEIYQTSQYHSALFEVSIETTEGIETSDLIKELEALKGFSITPLQKKVILLKSEGRGVNAIAQNLGIAPGDVQANIRQVVAEIRRIQCSVYSGLDMGSCEFIVGNKTVEEIQVLSCLGKGMSVKSTAEKLGKTQNGIRLVMHRSGVSARVLKKQRKSGPRFQNNNYSPPNTSALSLLWKYHSGLLSQQEKVEAEIILRLEGLIHSIPAIIKNNSKLLSMLSAQKRKRVFRITKDEEALLKMSLSGTKNSILDYSGASLISFNRYAREESELYGTSFTRTIAVEQRFWSSIQAAAGSISAPVAEQETGRHMPEYLIGRGSCVLLRDIGTDETFFVCLAGEHPAITKECHFLSPEAPLSEALYGCREGDRLSLEVVKGARMDYEVLKVQNA